MFRCMFYFIWLIFLHTVCEEFWNTLSTGVGRRILDRFLSISRSSLTWYVFIQTDKCWRCMRSPAGAILNLTDKRCSQYEFLKADGIITVQKRWSIKLKSISLPPAEIIHLDNTPIKLCSALWLINILITPFAFTHGISLLHCDQISFLLCSMQSRWKCGIINKNKHGRCSYCTGWIYFSFTGGDALKDLYIVETY